MAHPADTVVEARSPHAKESGLDYVQLIDRACQGDRSASDMLADDLYPKIWGVAHPYSGADLPVADLVQEAMLMIYARLHHYDPEFPFLPWAIRVAEARFKDLLRQRYALMRAQHLLPLSEGGDGPGGVMVMDERLSPEDELLRAEEAKTVREAVAQLPKLQRQIISLHWFGSVSYEAIAQDFELDRNRVYNLSYAARQRLGKILMQSEEGRES